MKQGQCGVYRLYKLGKGVANTFSLDYKKLERDLHVVTHDYAEMINKFSVINGSLYEYDEKASALYWQKKPFTKEEVYAETVAFEDLIDGTDGIVTRKTIEEVDAEIKEANAVNDIEHLRLVYNDYTDKQAPKTWGVKKLTEEIAKFNQ